MNYSFQFCRILASFFVVAGACWATADGKNAARAQAPQVKVTNIRRAFHNGEHNAFTDLCRFHGTYYLTFRSCPDGHMVHPTSRILVLSSDDGSEWREVHSFHVARRDCRDPHFLIFKDRMFVYTGTWYCGESSPKSRDLNQHLGFCAWTADGDVWNSPVMLEGTYGHYVWRAAEHGGRAYLCGRRKHEFQESQEAEPATVESALLVSDDGLVWARQGLFQELRGDETAFRFDEEGRIVAIARGGGKTNAQLCTAKAPYQAWNRTDLGRQVGGPLLARWEDRWLVGGRKSIGEARTALYWLINGELREIAELPSGGDNSYPGFARLGEKRALISYYSSHERDENGRPITAIYLAELRLVD